LQQNFTIHYYLSYKCITRTNTCFYIWKKKHHQQSCSIQKIRSYHCLPSSFYPLFRSNIRLGFHISQVFFHLQWQKSCSSFLHSPTVLFFIYSIMHNEGTRSLIIHNSDLTPSHFCFRSFKVLLHLY
jgi:hypothetical protein